MAAKAWNLKHTRARHAHRGAGECLIINYYRAVQVPLILLLTLPTDGATSASLFLLCLRCRVYDSHASQLGCR